jgi:hypothetical protein
MANPCVHIGAFCSLYDSRRFVIEFLTRSDETNTSSHHFAVLLSLMFAPHSGSGRSLLRFAGYAHGPFFIMPSYVDGRQFVLQTIFISVLFALIVNIPWPRRKKDDRD